tara:strand:+ start:59256 stop:59720 length:465 start_codon:yes stop_codon:yes gene_type:complete
MKTKATYVIVFLIINFGGLAIGSWLMNNGPMSDWYLNLNKAPWTPPGWVFGAAWTTIMICFSVYLMDLFTKNYNKKKLALYIIQLLLNVSWNYVFFNQHQVSFALIIILSLTALIFYFFFTYYKEQKKKSYLLLPYMVWLCIANSLNLYVLIHN